MSVDDPRFTADVIVVGAGPVGLTVACELRRAGVSVLVLERLAEPDLLPRAGSMGPLAFEAFARLGLRDEILAAEQATLRHYEQMFAEWRGTGAAGADPASPPERTAPKEHFGGIEKLDASRRTDPERRRVRIEQPVLEELLFRHALRLGVDIRREHVLVGLDQDEELVTAEVRSPAGTRREHAQYLVACDGADSSVRGLLGVEFSGTPASVTGRMAVVEMTGAEALQPGFHYTANGVYVHGLGLNRLSTIEFDGPPPGELTRAQLAAMTRGELEDSIRRVSGADVRLTEMSSGTRWIDVARQASAYRVGRVLLAGDAAHVYAPVGGQGLNVGIADGANLGWKLAAQVNRWASPRLLDTYQAERAAVAARLLANTRAQIALMRTDPQSTALRELFSELMDLDEAHRHIADMVAGMDVRYPSDSPDPLVGRLVGDLAVRLDGVGPAGVTGQARLTDFWLDGRGLLLDLADQPFVRKAAEPWARRVTTVTARGSRPDVDALLLRPDGAIAWTLPAGATFDDEPLVAALATWFGRPA
jgi:2-polyprenyl-6-methoxyphenol hydroxylase-like FAD-dependent oxidoreductase